MRPQEPSSLGTMSAYVIALLKCAGVWQHASTSLVSIRCVVLEIQLFPSSDALHHSFTGRKHANNCNSRATQHVPLLCMSSIFVVWITIQNEFYMCFHKKLVAAKLHDLSAICFLSWLPSGGSVYVTTHYDQQSLVWRNPFLFLMSGGAVFGNWLFGTTVIVVLFMVFYLCFKQERYVCIS